MIPSPGSGVACPEKPAVTPTPADAINALSRQTFRALGAARWALPDSHARSLARFAATTPFTTLGEVFDAALTWSERCHRSEYYYKNLLVSRLIFGRHSPRTASALLELGAGGSIADVVVLNGTSTVYEIKTDFDDFSRLPAQLSDYRACFEQIYVVVSELRVSTAMAQVPEDVGIIAIGRYGRLSERRPARSGLDKLRVRMMFGLLQKREVLEVLARTKGYLPDVPPVRMWSRTLEVFSTLSPDVAHHEVTRQLRARGERAAELATQVPASLRARAYDVPMTRPAQERMTHRLGLESASFLV